MLTVLPKQLWEGRADFLRLKNENTGQWCLIYKRKLHILVCGFTVHTTHTHPVSGGSDSTNRWPPSTPWALPEGTQRKLVRKHQGG